MPQRCMRSNTRQFLPNPQRARGVVGGVQLLAGADLPTTRRLGVGGYSVRSFLTACPFLLLYLKGMGGPAPRLLSSLALFGGRSGLSQRFPGRVPRLRRGKAAPGDSATGSRGAARLRGMRIPRRPSLGMPPEAPCGERVEERYGEGRPTPTTLSQERFLLGM